MKVRKTGIPEDSLLRQYMPADYSDVFGCATNCAGEINPDDVMVSFWRDFPWWVTWLFALRNFLVKIVRLKGGSNRNMDELERCVRSGGEYGFSSVPAKNEKETVLLLTDKHLDAYISVYVDSGKEKEVLAQTLVRYNNKLGNVYFFFIRPFHGIIVRSQLKRSVKTAASQKPKQEP